MRPISLRHRRFSLLLLAVGLGCGADARLAPPQFDNVIDTVTLYALTGTPIGTPSAFDGVRGVTVRTDLGLAFDFAVDLDGDVLQLKPVGTLGYVPEAGILVSTESFAEITSAPLDGYVGDTVRTADVGTVFVLRSRSSSDLCVLGGALPRYSKYRVLSVDPTERTVMLEFLVNRNCGYRGLEPGEPTE